MTVALLGFLHETNTFSPVPTTYRDFDEDSVFGKFLMADEVLELRGTDTGIGGFCDVCDREGIRYAPVGWCTAEPGGTVSTDAFERVMTVLLERLAALEDTEAVFLELHGAMVTQDHRDAELEILRRIRNAVGDRVLLVVSLDLHGNVSPELVAAADAVVAYRTYPHVDAGQTGARCAELFLAARAGKPLASRAFRSIPFFIPMHAQCTLQAPGREIYAQLEKIEQSFRGRVSLSFLTGFYLADTHWAGPSVIAYATDPESAEAAVESLVQFIEASRPHFESTVISVEEAVRTARHHDQPRPLVLAEVQDNAGCGGSSDVMTLLQALHAARIPGVAAALVHDPETLAVATSRQIGDTLDLSVGGHAGLGTPFYGEFVLRGLHAGLFRIQGPMGRGTTMDLGPLAVLTLDGIELVIGGKRAQNFDPGFFKVANIDPTQKRILVVKSTVHYRAAYDPISVTQRSVDTPGFASIRPGALTFKHLRSGVARMP